MIWRQSISDSAQDSMECTPSTARAGKEPNDHGVALVITLLLLFLLSVIGLAAVLSSSSDLLINGYYSNYRGSFYAADSGLNIARQAMYNQLNATFTTDFAPFVTPPPADIGALADLGAVPGTLTKYMRTNYGGTGSPCPINPNSLSTQTVCSLAGVQNTGTEANSWSQSFNIVPASVSFVLPQTFQNPTPGYSCIPTPGTTLGCPTAGFSSVVTSYTYTYNYTLTSVGSATGSETSTITENGTFIINVSGTPPFYNASYSIFGAFITNYAPCLGPLVPGTMTGHDVHQRGMGFYAWGDLYLYGPGWTSDKTASYWDSNWNCYQSPNSSFTAPNGQTIAPQFQDGFQVNQTPITQPANSYSQKWAAVDGWARARHDASPTNADLNADLKDVTGTPYPAGGAASGVYLNYQTVNGTLTMAGGGLYVEGNAQIVLTAQTGASRNNDLQQVYHHHARVNHHHHDRRPLRQQRSGHNRGEIRRYHLGSVGRAHE